MEKCKSCDVPLEGESISPACDMDNASSSSTYDSGCIGWAILGFFVPIAGLVLYLSWRDEKPKTAKIAGIGALISVIIAAILCVAMFICIVFGVIIFVDLVSGLGCIVSNLPLS